MDSEYFKTLKVLEKRYRVEKREKDWLGLPIVTFRTGGREEPPVLIAAGAVGTEPAGVYAALELVMQVDVERKVYVLPARDPTGFHDVSYVLSRMLREDVRVSSLQDLRSLLLSRGAEVVLEGHGIFLALLKGVGFAFSEKEARRGAYDTLEALEREVVKGGLADSLEEVRILVPAQMPGVEGVGEMGRLLTVMVSNGRLLTYDDLMSGGRLIPEAVMFRKFLDSIEPGMVVDLHEGWGKSFHVLVSDEPTSGEWIIIDVMLDQVARYGMRLATMRDVESSGYSALRDGVAMKPGACGLADYAKNYGYSFAFVTGRLQPLEQRIRAHVTACLSALNAYAIARL